LLWCLNIENGIYILAQTRPRTKYNWIRRWVVIGLWSTVRRVIQTKWNVKPADA
jgi:hypothetical protein